MIKELTLTTTVVRNFQKGEVTITLSDPTNEEIGKMKKNIVVLASQILDEVEKQNPPQEKEESKKYYKRRY